MAENTKIQFTYYDMSRRNIKVGKANTGRVVTDSTREKISKSNIGKHPNLADYGKQYRFVKGNPSSRKGKPGRKWTEA